MDYDSKTDFCKCFMLINANVKINQDLTILVAPIESKYWGY